MGDNNSEEDIDNPTLSGWEAFMYILITVVVGAWFVSDDLKEAGLWPEDTEVAAPQPIVARTPSPQVAQVQPSPFIAVDKKAVSQISTDLYNIIQQGIALHHAYDMADMNVLPQCATASQPLRAQTKALQAQIKSLKSLQYKMDLALSADAAFSCVYCSDNTFKRCTEALKDVERVRSALSAETKIQ